MGNCAMTFCCDNADARMAKPLVTESTPFGKQGKEGATKAAYIERYKLREEKCIQGGATTDIELCEFLQQNIIIEGIECLIIISSKPAHAYRLPQEEATVTGIQILGQMVLANVETLRIFHLNRQRLDWNRSQNISSALTECKVLEIVDLFDCLLNNEECIALFNALKSIPTMKELGTMRVSSQMSSSILPDNAAEITKSILTELLDGKSGQHLSETVYLDTFLADCGPNKSIDDDFKESDAQCQDISINFDLYDSEQDDDDDNSPLVVNGPTPFEKYAYSRNSTSKSNVSVSALSNVCSLTNNGTNSTDLTMATSNNNSLSLRSTLSNKAISSSGAKTMELWLHRDNNFVVHPVWIGNLPRNTTANELRQYIESKVGRVIVSIHINSNHKSPKQQQHIYAFCNLPTAEKQLLVVTLLDGAQFHSNKIIVRSNKPSRFPQSSFFGSSCVISPQFKLLRDSVVPAIISDSRNNLNLNSVRKILDAHRINVDALPNRVFCIQCTLTPKCNRSYCSFSHCDEEKELGRIIRIIASQDMPQNVSYDGKNDKEALKSRHTLLVKGLNNCMIRKSKSVKEIFESFGEVDHVMTHSNDTCFIRMKRALDAKKVVMLFKNNNVSDAVFIDFAPYYHENSQNVNGNCNNQQMSMQNQPKLNKKSMSLPTMPVQLQRSNVQKQCMANPMLQSAQTCGPSPRNQYSEYMKYQYQCYALWHQQQSNEYYAALMQYQQQQQQYEQQCRQHHQQSAHCLHRGIQQHQGTNHGQIEPNAALSMYKYYQQQQQQRKQSVNIPEPKLNFPLSPNLSIK